MEYSPIQAVTTNGFAADFSSPVLSKHSIEESNEQNSSLSSDLDSADHASMVSDGESPNSSQFPEFNSGLVRLLEGDRVHDLIRRKFVSGLGSLGKQATVISIHRNSYSGVIGQARVQSFQILTKAMKMKYGGDANVKYAWYGDSREEISNVLKHGFGSQINNNSGLYGCGIYLSPDDSPLER